MPVPLQPIIEGGLNGSLMALYDPQNTSYETVAMMDISIPK